MTVGIPCLSEIRLNAVELSPSNDNLTFVGRIDGNRRFVGRVAGQITTPVIDVYLDTRELWSTVTNHRDAAFQHAYRCDRWSRNPRIVRAFLVGRRLDRRTGGPDNPNVA